MSERTTVWDAKGEPFEVPPHKVSGLLKNGVSLERPRPATPSFHRTSRKRHMTVEANDE